MTVTSLVDLDSNAVPAPYDVPYPYVNNAVNHNVNMVQVRCRYTGAILSRGGTCSVMALPNTGNKQFNDDIANAH